MSDKILNSVNVRDDFNDNKIRKAWVIQLPDYVKEQYTKLPQEVKFALYKDIDNDVSNKWVEIMRTHFKTSIENGAKIIKNRSGGEYLEESYCVDSSEQLLEAGRIIVEEIIENIKVKNETV